jgi:hypothetical protein
MPNWIAITQSDLEDAKVAALVDALRTSALATGQTDPAPRVIADVVTEMRGQIGNHNRVDSDATKIPASLKPIAVLLILFALKNRLEIALTEDERTEQRRCHEQLNRIEDGKRQVETPDSPEEAPLERKGSVEVVSSRTRAATGDSMAGL